MSYNGSVSGTLRALTSYALDVVYPQTVVYDVYFPPVSVSTQRPPVTTYAPAVAQISLNKTFGEAGCTAWIFDVQTMTSKGQIDEEYDFFTGCVFRPAMVRVSFSLLSEPGAGDGWDPSWAQALANIFQFSPDSAIDLTHSHIAKVYG